MSQKIKNLEQQFHQQMLFVPKRAWSKCKYPANRFKNMVGGLGGLNAAKKLLASQTIPTGLVELFACGHPEISMEYLVLQKPWSVLFSETELTEARRRPGQ